MMLQITSNSSNSIPQEKQSTMNYSVIFMHVLWFAIVSIALLILKFNKKINAHIMDETQFNKYISELDDLNNQKTYYEDKIKQQQYLHEANNYKASTESYEECCLKSVKVKIKELQSKIFREKLKQFAAKTIETTLNLLIALSILITPSLITIFLFALRKINFENSLTSFLKLFVLCFLELVITCIGIIFFWYFDLPNKTTIKKILMMLLFQIFAVLIFFLILYKKWFRYIPPTTNTSLETKPISETNTSSEMNEETLT